MAVNTLLINTLDRTIVEDFGNAVRDSNPDIDPWSQNLVQNSMGVTRDGLGSAYVGGTKTGWTKVMVFRTGLAGAAAWRSAQGPAPAYALGAGASPDTEAQFVVYGTAAAPGQAFPSFADMTAPAYVQSYATLKEMYGSFLVPLEIIRADQNDHNMTEQLGAIIDGTARRVALREILGFWAEPAATTAPAGGYVTIVNAATVTVTTVVAAGTLANGAITVANSAISRYHLARLTNGETFDIMKSDGTQMNAGNQPVFACLVDPINVRFCLGISGGSDISLTAATYVLYPRTGQPATSASANTTATIISNSVPTPLNRIVGTDTTIYGITRATHPEFNSQVIALTGGETTLSEAVLNKYIGGHIVAKPARDRIDSLVTTPGVKNKYVNNQTWVGRRDRFSTPVKLSDGYQKSWDYEWDGTTMNIETSSFCPKGTLYGLKLRGGNFQKLTPPPIPGTGSDSRFGTYVEFMGNVAGTSIFIPARTTSAQFTDAVEAPFKRWMEFAADYLCGLKLSALDEDIATT